MRSRLGMGLLVLLGGCDGEIFEYQTGPTTSIEDLRGDAGVIGRPPEMPRPDAGQASFDAGEQIPDAGSIPDAGPTPDAGAKPDAGQPKPDAGPTIPDAGMVTVVNKTPPIRGSLLVQALTNGGLNPSTLPTTFAAADQQAHVTLMHGFADSIGNCDSCHSSAGYAVVTPQKKIARHMFEDITTKLRLKSGGVLWCDSCHQGKRNFLDRSNLDSLKVWMQDNFVDKLERKDGQKLECATCHGEPFDGDFVGKWGM
jgi:hypothetical protein